MNTFIIFETKKLMQLFDEYNRKHSPKLVYRLEMWIVLYEIIQFFPYATKRIYRNYDGQTYHYIDRDKMLSDIGVVRVSRNTLADIIRSLVALELIREIQIKDKEYGTYCYYAFGANLSGVLAGFSDYCLEMQKQIQENLETDQYSAAAKVVENLPAPTDNDAPPAFLSDDASYIRDYISQTTIGNDVDIQTEDTDEHPCENDIIPLPEVPPLPDNNFPINI